MLPSEAMNFKLVVELWSKCKTNPRKKNSRDNFRWIRPKVELTLWTALLKELKELELHLNLSLESPIMPIRIMFSQITLEKC